MVRSHHIRRQRLLLSAPDERQGLELRRRLRAAWDEQIEPALARALDAVVLDESEVLHIPRLELCLTLAAGDELLDVLPQLLYQALRERLSELVSSARAGRQEPGGARLGLVEDWAAEALEHFVVAGRLPWAAPARPREALAAALLQPRGIELMAARAHPAPVWFRALQLLDFESRPAFLERVLEALARSDRGLASPASGESRVSRESLSSALDAWLAPARAAGSGPAGSAGPVSEHERGLVAATWLASGLLPHAATRAGLLELARGSLAAGLDGPASERLHACLDLLRPAADAPHPMRRSSGEQRAAARAKGPASSATSSDDARLECVSCAGLVLLHPYLRPFLERRGALERGAPRADRLPRALALLQLLANGEDRPDPFHQGLLLVLLGRSPDEPLLCAPGLVDELDRAEAETLSRAVIEHWSVLGATSPAGLRSAFLRRRGWLRAGPLGWHLCVEPAAHDVLLQQLPWGIGLVQLSWMPAPLKTEWGPP